MRWCITRTLVRQRIRIEYSSSYSVARAQYTYRVRVTTQLISLLSDVYRMSEEEEEALEGPAEETEEEVSEGKG